MTDVCQYTKVVLPLAEIRIGSTIAKTVYILYWINDNILVIGRSDEERHLSTSKYTSFLKRHHHLPLFVMHSSRCIYLQDLYAWPITSAMVRKPEPIDGNYSIIIVLARLEVSVLHRNDEISFSNFSNISVKHYESFDYVLTYK